MKEAGVSLRKSLSEERENCDRRQNFLGVCKHFAILRIFCFAYLAEHVLFISTNKSQ